MIQARALRPAADKKSGPTALRPAVEELAARVAPAVFFPGQANFAVGTTPVAAAAGDFNGDGKPDVVVVNADGNSVSVLLNTTPAGAVAPSFAAQQTFAVGTSPYSVAVADFNGDGKPDLAVANYNDGTLSVLLNTTPTGAATVSFAVQQTFKVGGNPQALAAADFNGDGKIDLAVANLNDNTVSLLRNTTTAGAATVSFADQQTVAVGANPIFVAVADFNGDGKPDLAVTNYGDNTVSVLLNTTAAGATTFAFGAQQAFAAGTSPITVAVGDFNGDNKPDLAVIDTGSDTVSVLLNTTPTGGATPSFAAAQAFAVGGSPQSVAVADFDGDGKPDLAVTNFNDKTVSVLLNTTPAGAAVPAFAAQQTIAVGNQPVPALAGDFNGDGRPDLLIANSADRTASVLFNPATSPAVVLVGQFGGQGVWQYGNTPNTWVQLTPVNASALAADSAGDVVAEFPGYGVWEIKPGGGWQQIHPVDASALAINATGVVAAAFPGYGVGEYRPGSGWQLLTPATATLVAIDANADVVGEFPGYGVWEIQPGGGWRQLKADDASLLVMNGSGEIAANFAGTGLEVYAAGTWVLRDGYQAAAVAIGALGDVVASFAGFGVGEFYAVGGQQLLNASDAAPLAAGAVTDYFGTFPADGVWEYDPSVGWFQLRALDARLLTAA